MSAHRVAVIGDVHGNRRALEAACQAARDEDCAEMVFLGDLLTYGLDTRAVVEQMATLCAEARVTLIRGNHDLLYLSDGVTTAAYEAKLPPWLGESIRRTRASLPKALFATLPFVDEYEIGDLYFAHANPFGRDNWRYLNNDLDHLEAINALAGRGKLAGVFGHTHRPKVAWVKDKSLSYITPPISDFVLPPADSPYCVNAGSIGQPRDRTGRHHILVISISEVVHLSFVELNYDVSAFLCDLARSDLSAEAKGQLLKYF